MIFLIAKYDSGDQMKKNEMNVPCGTCGRQDRCIQEFGGETYCKEATWKSRCRWGIILKMVFKKCDGVGA